ncbi:IclR family transcriptional regulator [Acetobacter senegalensis]|uniref:IclR family transcriptional regulator n=1 Tax=Acetobacter senegalensis TaxID=446692 RepID=UPI0020A1047E|nr:IclR family transcriptional regulator [Acetobacter senegalensis]MCP1196045.1 IclR family transcriptional regulator [Acetobacter senegalensis]
MSSKNHFRKPVSRSSLVETHEGSAVPSGIMERTFAIIELLSQHGAGLPISSISTILSIPLSACHRLTTDLQALGYIQQEGGSGGRYRLTMKSVSVAFTFLASCGITDLAQPVLDRLAVESGELVRLAVPDGNRLSWVARAQGSRSGLKYDPEMGQAAHPSSTATGLAWLATMPDAVAVRLVEEQGYGDSDEFGPNAPRNSKDLVSVMKETRQRGFSLTVATFAPWMTAIACAVRSGRTDATIATLSIAGPTLRLPQSRALELGQLLVDAARELGSMQIIPRNDGSKT